MHIASPVNSSDTSVVSADRDQVLAWLELVHPVEDDGYSNGLMHICSVGNWEGRTFVQPTDAANYVMALDAQGAQGIYLRTTTLRTVPKQYSRGADGDSKMLPGFAADMDIAGPGHKTDKPLPLNEGECQYIIEMTGLPEPTLWVHSGGGVYPWWLLEHPLDLTTPNALEWAQEVSTRLHDTIAAWAEHLDLFYGSGVKDMSRVLRIPGTVNRKPGTEPKLAHIMQPAAYDFFEIDWLRDKINEAWERRPAAKITLPPRPAPAPVPTGGELRPGDEFNARAHWADILTPHGWKYMYHRGHTMYWLRPGKQGHEHSATTGRNGVGSEDRLFVFSDATAFEQNVPYNKFAAYALLEHGGDFSAATRELRRQGFGGDLPQQDRPFDTVSLVRPAKSLVGLDEAVDQQQPQVSTALVQANESVPTLGHDGLPVFTSDVYGTQHWDEMGLVSMYSSTFCRGLRYVHAVEEWMIWDGQRWTRDDMGRHFLASRKLLTGMLDYARKVAATGDDAGKNMVKKAERLATLTRVNSLVNVAKRDECITASPKDFNRHKNLVTVENGTLDLDTGKLTDFDPTLMLTKKINAVYTPGATGERTTAFLESVQPDPAMRSYMQRLAGYTLLGNADERVLPIVWGKSGSGKSAFLEMLYYVLGDFAAVADPTTLMPQPDNYQGPSEKLHSLMGNRFVKMSELPENAALNQALVKNITGSDTQKTRPLYGHPVEWQVEYTVWMATNNLPRITSTDDAIWKRVKPIHFPNVFVNGDGSVLNPADKDLGRQLARDEAPFILNWLLEGIREYRKHGLGEPEAVKDGVGEYRDSMDTTRQFMAQAQETGQIAVEEGVSIPARDLYKIYLAWAADSQVKFPVSINTFKARMLDSDYEQVRGSGGMFWKGIRVAGFIGAAQTPALTQDQWRGRTS